MNIAISGGTGFIGTHLAGNLTRHGHDVTIISRSKDSRLGYPVLTWQELEEQPEKLDGTDAIVNLAGASISKRWTPAYKQIVMQSRLDAAERIARAVERASIKPKVVLNGSGMSIYGESLTGEFDERSPARITGFLDEVVQEWEKAADQIQGVRLVKLRIGLVLGTDGGALPPMLMPYRLFVGGPVGSGRQWLSWIHIDDICRLILFCIEHPDVNGPINAVSPNPVTNDTFGRTVGRLLHRPHLIRIPAFVLKLLLGEMSTLLLDGQKVLPRMALEHGFHFDHPELEEALRSMLQAPK